MLKLGHHQRVDSWSLTQLQTKAALMLNAFSRVNSSYVKDAASEDDSPNTHRLMNIFNTNESVRYFFFFFFNQETVSSGECQSCQSILPQPSVLC